MTVFYGPRNVPARPVVIIKRKNETPTKIQLIYCYGSSNVNGNFVLFVSVWKLAIFGATGFLRLVPLSANAQLQKFTRGPHVNINYVHIFLRNRAPISRWLSLSYLTRAINSLNPIINSLYLQSVKFTERILHTENVSETHVGFVERGPECK